MENPIYSVVIPVYNEEESISESYKRLSDVMKQTNEAYELVFINDGSKDNSLEIMREFAAADSSVVILNFSRNFGHQNAITAGMEYARGDAVLIIDADLQDPPEVMLLMIAKYKEGYDVVYGKREKREGETFFKLATAKIFYRVLKNMTSVDIPVDTGDFRLISRAVRDAMKNLPEKNRYVRGLVSWVGFKQTSVEYVRAERFAGETKYPFKKMLKLALDGITSFSYKPLRLATGVGFFFSFLSFAYLAIVIIQRLFFSYTTEWGWASIVAIILFTQGVLLMLLGIAGEYIGRIYEEVKDRPNYIVAEVISNRDKL